MKKLLTHVEYLLQSHECVIIPGLGAILAHGTSACYDEKQQMWMPPRRVLSFNPELSRTDGLLASSMARREGISVGSANSLVKSAVEQMRRNFEMDGKVDLGKVGRLMLTEHGSMAFETADTAWLSPDTLWLPQFMLTKVASASQLAHKHEREEKRENRVKFVLRRTGQVAASIAVILVLGFMVKTGLSDMKQTQYASVAPVTTPTKVEIAQPKVEEPVIEENIIAQQETAHDSIRFNESDKYFLIVASLGDEAEAADYIKKNSDIELGILLADGRYRAYVATGRTQAEAMEAAEKPEIKSRYTSTWVCRK